MGSIVNGVLDENFVEVVYALPKYQHIFPVELSSLGKQLSEITILDVIQQSGILEYYPEIDLTINKVGVYSEFRELNSLINIHDRVEIYRPLVLDPIAARQLRAVKNKIPRVKFKNKQKRILTQSELPQNN